MDRDTSTRRQTVHASVWPSGFPAVAGRAVSFHRLKTYQAFGETQQAEKKCRKWRTRKNAGRVTSARPARINAWATALGPGTTPANAKETGKPLETVDQRSGDAMLSDDVSAGGARPRIIGPTDRAPGVQSAPGFSLSAPALDPI